MGGNFAPQVIWYFIMISTHRIITSIIIIFASINVICGQVVVSHTNNTIDADSLRMEFDKAPYFGLYKDNYFIFGPPLNHKPNRENTNVKFQISIQQKLTKSTLPGGTYLYLYYTQKVYWNVLEKSLPMTDINFNPGIGVAKPIFRESRYLGKLSLQLEHESNGRDSIQSRSWNKISFGGNILLTPNWLIHAKFWIPIVDGENNKDILKYKGIFQIGVQAKTDDNRWKFGLLLVKRKDWKPNYNIISEIKYRFSKKADWSFFLQYYNGYGEDLLDYKTFKSQLRAGIVITPPMFSDY